MTFASSSTDTEDDEIDIIDNFNDEEESEDESKVESEEEYFESETDEEDSEEDSEEESEEEDKDENDNENKDDDDDGINIDNLINITINSINKQLKEKSKKQFLKSTEDNNKYFHNNSSNNNNMVMNDEINKESRSEMENKEMKELLKNSLVGEEYKRPSLLSKRKLKQLKQNEKEKTAGKDWYNLPATKMTPEIKRDLILLKNRHLLYRDRFYKAPDSTVLPKYFQIGTVITTAKDYYTSRVPKKQRANSFVDKLLKDSEFRKYTKKKYSEIQKKKQSGNRADFKKKKLGKRRKYY
eukprot:TRINITY_DN5214_c0_g1_i1.p1 TRINITY_DN5214_c0_g1~~TRINITY_DN5214_c0_g1_i1.p1  ORF type:complete len:297 (-),score=112.22 TRINITY_DN5214_c0_g1_i1:86-976(-)